MQAICKFINALVNGVLLYLGLCLGVEVLYL